MKSVKTLALAGLSILFVACGGNNLVEMKNDRGWNQELYEFGLSEIQKKYPDYKPYHYESLKTASFLQTGVESYRFAQDFMTRFIESNPEMHPKDASYNDMVFLYKDDKDFRLVYISCNIQTIGKNKGQKYCSFNDKSEGIY